MKKAAKWMLCAAALSALLALDTVITYRVAER